MPKLKNIRKAMNPALKGWRRYWPQADTIRGRLNWQGSQMARGKMAAVGSSDKLRAAGSRSDQTRAWRPAQVRRGELRRFYEQCLLDVKDAYYHRAFEMRGDRPGQHIPAAGQTYVVDNARARFYGTLWRKLSGVST